MIYVAIVLRQRRRRAIKFTTILDPFYVIYMYIRKERRNHLATQSYCPEWNGHDNINYMTKSSGHAPHYGGPNRK